MALLRKDIKAGFIAGGVLLALAGGYGLVLSMTAGSGDRADAGDPLADPIETLEAEPARPAARPLAATTTSPLPAPAGEGWGADTFGSPVVTDLGNLPIQTVDETDAFAPDTPDLNQSVTPDPLPLAETPQPAPVGMTLTHTVRPGENLSSIANDYYGDPNLFAAIRDANPGLDPRRMRVGQTLRIPPMDDAVEERATPAPAATGTPGETHTVKPGETLTKIAADRLGRSNLWMDLYELNRDVIGSDPEALKVGMVLRLPG